MGKSIYRLYGCIEEAFPEDKTVFYKGLFQHIASMEQDPSDETSFANVLKAVGAKHSLRKRLLGYMNYGVCAVRLDFIKIIRLKAPGFFGMPGTMTMSEISSLCVWLTDGNRFHERSIDAENRYCPALARPFGSELIPQVLRSILVERRSKQDSLLYALLCELELIPIPLIALITALIGHALRKYGLGSNVSLSVSLKNLGQNYVALKTTCQNLDAMAKPYFEKVQKDMFTKMIRNTTRPLEVKVYDYAALMELPDSDEEKERDDEEEMGEETGKEKSGETGQEGGGASETDASMGDASTGENEDMEPQPGGDEDKQNPDPEADTTSTDACAISAVSSESVPMI